MHAVSGLQRVHNQKFFFFFFQPKHVVSTQKNCLLVNEHPKHMGKNLSEFNI